MSGLCRERLAAAAAGHRHLKRPQEIAVDIDELLDTGAAGEGPEPGQVGAVGAGSPMRR